MLARSLIFCLVLNGLPCAAPGAEPPAVVTAAELARSLNTNRQDPGTHIRLRMELQGTGEGRGVLQVQIKSRVSAGAEEVVYQVLWPKERKGESVLLRKAGNAFSGAMLAATGEPRRLDAGDLKESLFGSDLAFEDIIDNPFAWEHQALGGTETVGRITCQILESKPGAKDRSSYTIVRTWVDPARLVPLRIEKYGRSAELIRRIEITDVVKDKGRFIPAKLVVRNARKNSATELDGSRIKHDMNFTDQDFRPEALKNLNVLRNE